MSSFPGTDKKKEKEGPPVTYSRFSRATAASTKGTTDRSRDPSPITSFTATVTKARSREPSPTNPLNSNYLNLSSIKSRSRDPSPAEPIKRLVPPVSYSGSGSIDRGRSTSREPSPLRTSSYSKLNKDNSGSYSCLKRLSRESSPVDGVTITGGKDKYGFSASYHPSQYSPKIPVNYSRTNSSTSISNSASTGKLDPSLSYMTSTEIKVASHRRSLSRGSSADRQPSYSSRTLENSYDKTNKEIQHISAQIQKLCNGQADYEPPRNRVLSPPTSKKEIKIEPKVMVKVDVITRGTSPTKPSCDIPRSTSRRTETVAKTIEKTISRPLNRPDMHDKEIQSDRMDDTTRSSRYAFSPRSTSSYSSSYSPVSYPSSRMTGVRSVRDVSSSPVSSSSPSSNRTNTSSSGSKTPKSPEITSKDTPKSSSKTSSNSSSPTSNGCLKWANKDFRKSALNMGNSTPSTPTTPTTPTQSSSDATKQVQLLFPETQQRESSTESETSSSSSLSDSPPQEQRAQTSVSIDEMPTTYVNDQLKTDQPKSFLAKNFSPVKIKIQNKSSSSLDQNWLDDTTVSESLVNDTERIWSPDTNISFNLDSRVTPAREKSATKDNASREGSAKPGFKIQSVQSGERAWWLASDSDKSGKTSRNSIRWTEEENDQVTEEIERVLAANESAAAALGARTSPEGVEDHAGSRKSLYDNVTNELQTVVAQEKKVQTPIEQEKQYISRYSNIDDILGGTTSLCNAFSPISDRIFAFEECQEISPDQVKVHDSTPQMPIIKPVLE